MKSSQTLMISAVILSSMKDTNNHVELYENIRLQRSSNTNNHNHMIENVLRVPNFK